MLSYDVIKSARVALTFRMNKMPQSLEAFLGPEGEKWFNRDLEGPRTKLHGIISKQTLSLTYPREFWS